MVSFINLNRSFEPISKESKFNEEEYDFSDVFGSSTSKKWDDLLKLHRVIILAEAGAGKTEEIRAITDRLRKDGKKAFFFRLEHLSSDFETSFFIGNNTEFNEWLASDDPGWFFLDSVDEARLSGPKQFETAIRKFANKLGNSKQRTYIYITSRFSEWRARADLSLIKERIPYIELAPTTIEQDEDNIDIFDGSSDVATAQDSKSERKPIEPALLVLRPLDQDQIRTFSQSYCTHDIDAFLTAIERAEADIFSRRPQDLIELINYWGNYGKIANRAKMIEASIVSKLHETDPDRAAALPLNSDDAMYGAEMLAAAVTFLKKNRILVPEQNPDSAIKTEAIGIQTVLTNWEPKKTQALLQRPIFDEAIYGTVRFHHRSVREYLTAKWLHRLLGKGKSRRAIENLFFTERYGLSVLVPSMRPILAWLILFDDRIRQKAVDLAPEVLLPRRRSVSSSS